jgi:hypothetical protein
MHSGLENTNMKYGCKVGHRQWVVGVVVVYANSDFVVHANSDLVEKIGGWKSERCLNLSSNFINQGDVFW